MSRARPQGPWLLRLWVEVEVGGQRTIGEARAAAHDLAVSMRAGLTCAALQRVLHQPTQKDFVATFRPWPRTYDSLPGEPDDPALIAWRTRALQAEKPIRHQAFSMTRAYGLPARSKSTLSNSTGISSCGFSLTPLII